MRTFLRFIMIGFQRQRNIIFLLKKKVIKMKTKKNKFVNIFINALLIVISISYKKKKKKKLNKISAKIKIYFIDNETTFFFRTIFNR